MRKWQLACVGNIAHVVVMPSVDKAKLQHFFDEYIEAREANAATSPPGSVCSKPNLGDHCLCHACKPKTDAAN